MRTPQRNFEWYEELPEQCPPADARTIHVAGETFYRFGELPVTSALFDSQRKIKPTQHFKLDECQARSVSVFPFKEIAEFVKNEKLPNLRNKEIIAVTLFFKDGLVKNTPSAFSHKTHHSWWRSTAFSVSQCAPVQ